MEAVVAFVVGVVLGTIVTHFGYSNTVAILKSELNTLKSKL